MKAFFEIYNWRFWWFCFVVTFPLWFGIIGYGYLCIKEKITMDKQQTVGEIGDWFEYDNMLFSIAHITPIEYICKTIIYQDAGPIRYGEEIVLPKNIVEEALANERALENNT